MGYDKQKVTRHYFTATAWGSAGGTRHIRGPKGKAGTLVDYGIDDITATFTNVSTGCLMKVGVNGALAQHGINLDLGAAAAADGSKSVLTTYRPGKDAAYVTHMPDRSIDADTVVIVTFTAATGGSPAGTSKAFVDIIWDD